MRVPNIVVGNVTGLMRWLLLVCLAGPVAADGLETPALRQAVAAGQLPSLAQRLPLSPRVMPMDGPDQSLGIHGGTLRTLIRKQKDVKLISVYGYARLVGYRPDLSIQPDILEAVTVEAGRIFTLHLRPGHKWSDGHPFTARDFRYWWEDVANNARISLAGRPET